MPESGMPCVQNMGEVMNILAIDPGSENSAVMEWDTESEINLGSGIWPNEEVADRLWHGDSFFIPRWSYVLIEGISSYGMPVGKTVFETCIWIGRFIEALRRCNGQMAVLIYRQAIKMHFCNSIKAKDSNIRQALIDRLGKPGTKSKPGKTYGITKDEWSSLALAVYWMDTHK